MVSRRHTCTIAAVFTATMSLVATGHKAKAQSVIVPRAAVEQKATTGTRKESSFRASMGVAVAERLIASDDAGERLRGVERLGALGTPEAIDALLKALEQGSALGRDPKARLLGVRALAPFAKREAVRQQLARELGDAAGADGRGSTSPLSALTRTTAALALARSALEAAEPKPATGATAAEPKPATGATAAEPKPATSATTPDPKKQALAPLVTALVQGGAPAEAAARALAAYPPASLTPFFDSKKRLSAQLATYLGELGDLRAIERLRVMLSEADPAAKAAAALALAKLGDEAALAPARSWQSSKDPRLQRASAEALAQLVASDAPQAIALLLANDALRIDGIRLASASPSPSLATALATAINALPAEDRWTGVAALGRAGGAEAVKQLGALLSKPELAVDAAFALAMMKEPEARARLEEALAKSAGDKKLERAALRAGIMRALALRDPPAALRERLSGLLTSEDATDRSIAAMGLVAIGARDTADLLDAACPLDGAKTSGALWRGAPKATSAAKPGAKGCDEIVVRAAARGALARGGTEALDPFLKILEAAARSSADAGPGPAPETIIAAGVALLARPDGGELPTSVLAGWAESGGPLAPLAARALPSRDDEAIRGRIKRLLSGSDPVVRAHVALGLAHDPEPDAVSLLTSAYRFEDDASVRRAIIRALSARPEAQREETLSVARDLDPDPGVRSLARAALAGRAFDERGPAPPRGVPAWITLAPNDPSAAAAASSRAARVVRADGVAVPVVADPDGGLLVPGLPPGPLGLFLGRAGGL